MRLGGWEGILEQMAVTMPRWPAYIMLAAAAACAYPAVNTPAPTPAPVPAHAQYRAIGQEPGWILTIANERIDYVGDYGETKINVASPEPRTTFNGHRYDTSRLTVDITHSRCNDAMSGHGYADSVIVTADGKTVRGCGGDRRADWDL